MTESRLPELHALLAEPDELARSVVSSVETGTNGQWLAVGLFSSAWEVYRGIRVLLERRLGEEARILFRILLEDAALLMWFVTRQDELDLLALRYYWTSERSARGVASAARANGWEWAEEMFQERSKRLDELRAAAQKEFGIEKLERLPRPEELLSELGQEKLYYWHTRASQTIHSTAIGISSRVRAPQSLGDPVSIPLEAPVDETAQTGIMAAEVFLSGLAAACGLLGWEEKRVREMGDAFSPRAEKLYREIIGETDQNGE